MYWHERQLTFAQRSHQLTNINVWTPCGQWLVYDVRPDPSSFTGLTIERLHLSSGNSEVIYQAQHGAHVGVVTVSPQRPLRYVFIHGPEHPDAEWHYDFHHRRGVIVHDADRDAAITLDAMDITPPYTAGALRGGSHVHVFSPDGSRLSFTYNDHVMHQRDQKLDLRNVAVAVPLRPVLPVLHHRREYGGSHYCVLVSRTTPTPQPGSDQIDRAYEEGWVGQQGYRKADGSQQRWALAFIGDTRSACGNKVAEIFLVDLPEDLAAYAQPGDMPLQGTPTELPAPPKGVVQRRLTYTAERRYPGLVTTPRHWLRSSPDGSAIAFLMRDDQGIVQLWSISPNGGAARQITHSAHDIQSAFSWHPQGDDIALVCDNSVMLCQVASGEMQRVTVRSAEPPQPEAVVFSPCGNHIAFMRRIAGVSQIFVASV
ncbi:DUF3748 domain-containing protein [Serratia microhaemolytica]|uniref:DUF3748 domain-containing protein n=1 Tax=Serratia microhaemolytica TaxID=2675110 RepID=UPI000FDE3D16|nr:DUF3748 domain-containing protein [Serratia microhaemolytica]